MTKGYLIEKIIIDKININKKIEVSDWYGRKNVENKESTFYNKSDNEFKNLNTINWLKSTVGKDNENIIIEDVRDSYISDENFIIKEFDLINEDFNPINDIFGININTDFTIIYDNKDNYLKWNLIKYPQNGFFKKHSDGKKDELHFGTALLIPPYSLNRFEGGELVLYGKNGAVIEILPEEDDWKLVIIGLDIEHELKKVINGERYVFKTEMEMSYDDKLLLESKSYTNQIENIKMSDKELEKEKKNIEEKIKELEKELERNKNMYNFLLEGKIGKIDVSEFLEEIEIYLKKNNEDIFMVALLNYYRVPIPDNFKMKDAIIYNGLLDKFKNDDIKINIMNIKTKLRLNNGEPDSTWDSSDLSLCCWVEDYKPDNEIDQEYKFKNIDKFYPKKFFDELTPGDCFHSTSQYNDSTYDYIELSDVTYLYVTIKNNYYKKNNEDDSNEDDSNEDDSNENDFN